MFRFMIIKIYPDGSKADFVNDPGVLDRYLLSLRDLERAYQVFSWSEIRKCYYLVKEWTP